MRHTIFSNLYSLSRYSLFQTPPRLFFRSRICLVIEVFFLLVLAAVCLEIPPAQASNHTVRFAVIGDYGVTAVPDPPYVDPMCAPLLTSKAESDVKDLVIGWNPDFIVTTGDNNYMLGEGPPIIDQNITQYYQGYITTNPLTNRFYPSLGNHDWGDVVPGNADAYRNYFTLPDVIAGGPGNKRYYHVGRGPVHLFAIDSDRNEPDMFNPSTLADAQNSTQAIWLQGRLADPSNAEPWKLVFFHHPPYSSGCYAVFWMQWPFQAWGATAVLSGHEHFYERLSILGLPYFINGLGGYPKFNFGVAISGSQKRYNDDFGAMLVQASPTCINFQFIDRGGTQQDTYTLYRLSQIPSETPSQNLNPPVDYYVRDWTDSPASGDTGKVPSTHPQFYTTSDVWNRQSNAAGGFNANNQPQNEDPKNGPGSAGNNFAFARILRNTCGNGPADTVTARFLYSEFGTGSNFQTAGSASGALVNFAADTVLAADTVHTMTTGHSWHLDTTSSTHLCLATEISTPSDPSGPTLLGHAPGWPTTDNMVLNDNNKAQRNMGVYHTMLKSVGKWSYYALAHNAATYKRSMILRYEAPPEVLKSKVRLEVIHPQKMTGRPEGRLLPETSEAPPERATQLPTSQSAAFRSGETLILEEMQPGENRWIGVTFESVDGREGEALPVSFFEVVNNKPVNGFTIAAVPASWPIVSRDILKLHASVFARLAALFGIAKANEESVEAAQVLQMEKITERDYITHFRKQISSINDIIAELLRFQRAEDVFGIRGELKNLSAAIQEGAVAHALPAHSTVLHKLDAFLTMLQKSKGDPADILQNVVWQTDLFAKLPRQRALECSNRRPFRDSDKSQREAGDVEVESKEFRKAYETRKISNKDYPSLISDLLPCFKETAKEFGGMARLDEDIANMISSLDSPVALQKAHYEYLLKLEHLVNKP